MISIVLAQENPAGNMIVAEVSVAGPDAIVLEPEPIRDAVVARVRRLAGVDE